MYEVPDPSVPAGTVVQVVQAGFMIGERVLRPALVAVSKGGAKAASLPSNKLMNSRPDGLVVRRNAMTKPRQRSVNNEPQRGEGWTLMVRRRASASLEP